jgi:hypothetical protein
MAGGVREQIVPRKKTDPDINQLAKSLGPLYHIVTGVPPTRRNRTDYGHKSYGPFLEFVEDVFKLAGITAPAADYARKACKEFNASRANHGVTVSLHMLLSHCISISCGDHAI